MLCLQPYCLLAVRQSSHIYGLLPSVESDWLWHYLP